MEQQILDMTGGLARDLVIAVLGGLIVIKLPNWWQWFQGRLAHVSRRFRAARLRRLETELEWYRQKLSDPLEFQGTAILMVAVMMMIVFCMLMMTIGSVALALAIALSAHIHPGDPLLSEGRWMIVMMMTLFAFFAVRASFRYRALANFTLPQRNLARLQGLIERLRQNR